ncbi:MAG: nuclear transport factor 2 family protein [Solirubrobacteraceae bacterium]|nr:nuclear transport factor 2 family protein [Solirubrobacteraceae bacterium]
MTTIENLMSTNVTAVFNERDDARRRAAIEDIYTADASAYATEGSSSGWDGVDALVLGLLENAGDMQFTVSVAPSAVADVGRVTWELAAPGGPPVVRGTDVAIVRDGKIAKLYTFIEPTG